MFAYSTNCSKPKSIEKPPSSASGHFIQKLIRTKNLFYIIFSIVFSLKLFYIVSFYIPLSQGYLKAACQNFTGSSDCLQKISHKHRLKSR